MPAHIVSQDHTEPPCSDGRPSLTAAALSWLRKHPRLLRESARPCSLWHHLAEGVGTAGVWPQTLSPADCRERSPRLTGQRHLSWFSRVLRMQPLCHLVLSSTKHPSTGPSEARTGAPLYVLQAWTRDRSQKDKLSMWPF